MFEYTILLLELFILILILILVLSLILISSINTSKTRPNLPVSRLCITILAVELAPVYGVPVSIINTPRKMNTCQKIISKNIILVSQWMSSTLWVRDISTAHIQRGDAWQAGGPIQKIR